MNPKDHFLLIVILLETVEYKNKEFKVACFRVKRSFGISTFILVCLFVFLIIETVITNVYIANAPASVFEINFDTAGKEDYNPNPNLEYDDSYQEQRKSFDFNQEVKKSRTRKYGLIHHPNIDASSVITFDLKDPTSYHKYVNVLNFESTDYGTGIQSDKKMFTDCTNASDLPIGKECRLDANEVFGSECRAEMDYGYYQGMPCILLQLKLPVGFKPIPFTKNSSWYFTTVLSDYLGNLWSPDHVSVTCDGDDEGSTDQFRSTSTYPKEVKIEDLLSIKPPHGFPVSFFNRGFRYPQYVPPAVMVQFNTLRTNVLLNITCVAWAQNFNNGEPQSSPLYTSKFKFYIKR